MDERVIENKVVFCTYHSSKGRQRKYVIVLNFDNSYFDFNETAQLTGATDLTQSRFPDGGPTLTSTNIQLLPATPGTYNSGVFVNEFHIENTFSLYPNPTSNNFNIQWNSTTNELVQVRISDITGKIVYQDSHAVSVGMNTLEMDSQSWTSGYYTIELKVNDCIGRMQLMKN
jgi:hypothetical protein